MLRLFVCTALFLTTCAGTLIAQNLEDNLAQLRGAAVSENYSQILPTEYTYLNDDETHHMGLKLVAGRTYRIIAACDADCEDMDMFLYGDETVESLLESDELADAVPLINFTPTETKVYRVKLGMYNCGIEPCQTGVALMRKDN